MKTLDVDQGSPAWLAARANYFCASDAPVMKGVSKKTTRTELLRMKASGDVKIFSDWVQANLIDKGHETERAARAILEEQLGEELYPITATDDADYLLASFDGTTMDGETGFEHKLWNKDIAAQVRAGELDPSLYWQLEQQILVGGLKRVIFVCSDGTTENWVQMEYLPVPGRAEQLLAGWKQFEEDLANYQHVEVLPAPTGKAIMALPALTVQLSGKVKSSNLEVYRVDAMKFIAAINTNLQTDQDFADAEQTVKFCGDSESTLDMVKSQALAQTATIDELFRTIDELREAMRAKRLTLEKLVKTRKDTIREEIRRAAADAYATHITLLNTRLGKPYMPDVPADFAGVMKGKKTISSLRDAVNTELARVKIESNAVADKIEINLRTLRELATDHPMLFADMAQIVLKANDDLTALIRLRISEHAAAEDRKRAAAAIPAAASPAPVAEAPAARTGPRGAPPKPFRPTDDAIVHLLATTYQVHASKVIDWLRGMDLDACSERLPKKVAA